jgi:hypothetical protein
MLCPACNHPQRYREGLVCRACSYHYVLSPKTYPGLTDRRVVLAAGRVGAQQTRWFTGNQLLADLGRRRKLRLGFIGGAKQRKLEAHRAALRYFHDLRPVQGLLTRPALEVPPVGWPEPDLYDYGAERILVVDRQLVVDLLVRTGVHVEGRAVILSADGYPRQVLIRARALVAQRPDIPVFVLHGTRSPAAEHLDAARRLLGLPVDADVRDLGLPPDAPSRLKVLRWTRGIKDVPVDCLPHRYLTAPLIGAMSGGAPLEDAQRADDGGDGMFFAWLASEDDYG